MKQYKHIYTGIIGELLEDGHLHFDRGDDKISCHETIWFGFIENSEDWVELQPKEEYKIIEFHFGDNTILSVKRLCDGELFAVGDFARTEGKENKHKITSIEIRHKQPLGRGTYDGIDRIWLNWEINAGGNWLENSEKVKEPLFTTVDGVEIFNYDEEYYLVTADFKIGYCSSFSEGDLSFNCFSAKEKAEEWIIMNKPMFSLMELAEELNPSKRSWDEYREMAKNKLKL